MAEDDILDRLRDRALQDAARSARDLGEESVDLLDLARGGTQAQAPADQTLGGYVAVHDRPPAFEGSDGEAYSVAIEVEETGDPGRPFVAFLVFVRWAATGAGIMGHVESDDVAAGDTGEGAVAAALDLSLYQIKAALDRAIERRNEEHAR